MVPCTVSCVPNPVHAWIPTDRERTVFLTTIPTTFQETYRQPIGIAGLHYFALGVGLSGASQLNARMLDKVYKYFTAKNGGVGRPEYRLRALLQL